MKKNRAMWRLVSLFHEFGIKPAPEEHDDGVEGAIAGGIRLLADQRDRRVSWDVSALRSAVARAASERDTQIERVKALEAEVQALRGIPATDQLRVELNRVNDVVGAMQIRLFEANGEISRAWDEVANWRDWITSENLIEPELGDRRHDKISKPLAGLREWAKQALEKIGELHGKIVADGCITASKVQPLGVEPLTTDEIKAAGGLSFADLPKLPEFQQMIADSIRAQFERNQDRPSGASYLLTNDGIRRVSIERDMWREQAMQERRNTEFYSGLVTNIGKLFGTLAFTADDGVTGDSVHALKVPELVAKAIEDRRRYIDQFQQAHTLVGMRDGELRKVEQERDGLRAKVDALLATQVAPARGDRRIDTPRAWAQDDQRIDPPLDQRHHDFREGDRIQREIERDRVQGVDCPMCEDNQPHIHRDRISGAPLNPAREITNLEKHAESELRRAGRFDADSDYDGALGPAVMELIRAMAGKGHTGGSAALVLSAFNRVARFKSLTPLTNDPDEWMEIGEDQRADRSVPLWQSRRESSCFSNDGGKTYYDIDANDNRAIKMSQQAAGGVH